AYVRRKDHASAVQTYQQILSDRSLPGVGIKMRPQWRPPGGHKEERNLREDSFVEAGTLARIWIERLMADFGPEVYAKVERRARDRLEVAGASKDAVGMLAVAEEFPNSRTSAMALLAHARLMRDRSDWKSAARSYRRALNRRERVNRPEMLREFAICLIQSGSPDVAGHWLDRATRDYPSERFAHNGRIISFKQLREELVGKLGLSDVTVPKMRWPVTRVYQRLYADPVAVLNPTFSSLPETRWDILLTYSGRSLELRQPATDRALWPRPVECQSEPVLLGMDADRFVLATRNRLFALTRTSGQLAWQVGEPPVEDPNADPETLRSWTEFAMTPTRLFAANDRRELLCINLSDGAILWRKDQGPRAGGSLVADRDRVCFAAWKGRQNTLAVLDAATGEPTRTIFQEEDRPIQTLKLTPDGILLVVLSNGVIAVDPRSGETRWRIDCHDHLVLSTLHVDPEGLFVSSDGRRIDKYDLETGRPIWSTPPLCTNKHGGLWARISGGVLYAASSDTLVAYDTADGQPLWTAADPPGLTHAPQIVKDAIVTVLPEKDKAPGRRLPGADEIEETRYRLLRFDLRDGRRRPSGHEPEKNLDHVATFGGLFVRDRCLLILDGNRLIGYVGAEP
ncbi:MAG: PQQ-binding-like beta-propeller repeat protein, partial [Planctomycetota bacterium]|nr:PQQ-binding-like beta-propeller repeat protein [Planctomycetota bacterium]